MSILTPEEMAEYANRRAIFLALEKAVNGGTGLVMQRHVIAHPIEDVIEVAFAFHFVNAKEDAPWPACDCGDFFAPGEEVAEYMGDAWGPWVG